MRVWCYALVCLLLSATFAEAAPKLSPTEKVGTQKVRIAYEETDLEWVVIQKHFLVDGKRYAIPPRSVGYDPAFSAPGWIAKGGKISGIKFWHYNKETGKKRKVVISFPRYSVLSRGKWQTHGGSDTVEDPPI